MFSAASSADKLTEFKRWFWSVVSSMNHPVRQELLYFWTGSPALPASEDGFQPLPTITIRPPDDQHLPTANTCISRLYVPLYSTRYIKIAFIVHYLEMGQGELSRRILPTGVASWDPWCACKKLACKKGYRRLSR